MSAIYHVRSTPRHLRSCARWQSPCSRFSPAIPTVVYGFFAALVDGARSSAGHGAILSGIDVASESALAAGLVMGVMIIPFVSSSLSDDAITAVPRVAA